MKIRTDFVTNSSSSSFIAFSIKSNKMVEELEEIGFRFELENNDTITETDTIITPDGQRIIPEHALLEGELFVREFDSTVFEWFLDMFGGYDAFFESCEDDDDEANKITSIENSINECEIVGGDAITDEDGSFCMHITIKNGQKAVSVLTDEKWNRRNGDCLGVAILEGNEDIASLADKYGSNEDECEEWDEEYDEKYDENEEHGEDEVEEEVVIPEGVTYIGQYEFSECTDIKSVFIPNGVTTIDEGAFAGCSSLINVNIPSSVTFIGESAFADCSSLSSITIPNGIESIGASTFNCCSNLTNVTIPSSVMSIGEAAFSQCSNLTSVVIPDSVTNIDECAFSDCSSLWEITISNNVKSIEHYTFGACHSLVSVTIPDGVISIGSAAFAACFSLASVIIPDSVKKIASDAFFACSNLTILSRTGSYAEAYAQKNKIPFIAI